MFVVIFLEYEYFHCNGLLQQWSPDDAVICILLSDLLCISQLIFFVFLSVDQSHSQRERRHCSTVWSPSDQYLLFQLIICCQLWSVDIQTLSWILMGWAERRYATDLRWAGAHHIRCIWEHFHFWQFQNIAFWMISCFKCLFHRQILHESLVKI